MNDVLQQPYPWQSTQWQNLHRLLDARRLPHALLFSGPPGVGKRRFADAVARLLLCDAPGENGACGACESCVLLRAESHPDLRLLEPAEGKRQIQVDQVRQLIAFCNQTAHRDRGRKVALIAPAEAMNRHTANALLKTLEEPASDTVLILLSHVPSLLLPTVRSRCLSIAFPVPSPEQASSWLSPLTGGEAACQRLLMEAGGRPLTALALYESDGLAARQACDDALLAMTEGRSSPVEAAEQLLEHELDFVLEWLTLRLNALGKQAIANSDESLPQPWQQWRRSTPGPIYTLLQRTLELRRQSQQGVALNKRLAVESLLLECRDDWL